MNLESANIQSHSYGQYTRAVPVPQHKYYTAKNSNRPPWLFPFERNAFKQK